MIDQELNMSSIHAKFAREAVSEAKARSASPEELAPLLRRERDTAITHAKLAYDAVKRLRIAR